jgi:glycosyltransferase involved in cell wall biosynthesis
MPPQKENNSAKGPLISVGLCVRNGAEYISEALDSILAQTYKNFELVISDNVSTDDTQKICEEYARKDKRVRYIRQREDLGGYGNYDFVRREARGDYFVYASNDDLWHPRFIEKCLAKFGEEPGAIMVFSNFYTFDDSGKVRKYRQEQYFPFARHLYGRLKEYLLSLTLYGKTTLMYGMWKKGTATDLIPASELRSDILYVFRTLCTGYFTNIPDVLFYKRLPIQTSEPAGRGKKPTIDFLATLPGDYEYETADDWMRIRRENQSPAEAAKSFVNDRRTAARYSYMYSKEILRAPSLAGGEKIKLLLWDIYAFIRSFFWYGNV